MKLFNDGKVYEKILVLPDMHVPFMQWNIIKIAAKWAKIHKPDLVIQLGDILDQKAWSRFPKDPDDYSPHEEMEISIQALNKLSKMFPKMEILMGNHDLRIAKAALEVGFTKHIVRDLEEIFPYEGWNWHADPKKKLIVNTRHGPVYFDHGDSDGGTAAQKSRLFGISVIQGHTHQASIEYSSTLTGTVFGAEAGHLMDRMSKGARYAVAKGRHPTAGIMVVKHGVPYFVPLSGNEKEI